MDEIIQSIENEKDPDNSLLDPNSKPMDPEEKFLDPEDKSLDIEEKPMDSEEKSLDPEEKSLDPEEKSLDPKNKELVNHDLHYYQKLEELTTYSQGYQAITSLLEGNIIKKRYPSDRKKFYKKEAKILKLLSELDFVPKILCLDPKNLTIYMNYCGEPIKDLAKYKDIIHEYVKILKDQYNLYHNDIKPGNICSIDGKLYLIDFGWADKKPYKKSEKDYLGNMRKGYNTVNDAYNYKKEKQEARMRSPNRTKELYKPRFLRTTNKYYNNNHTQKIRKNKKNNTYINS